MRPIDKMFSLGAEMLSRDYQKVHKQFRHLDLFGYNPGGECCEIEVKTADYDLRKEFAMPAKKIKHLGYLRVFEGKSQDFSPTYFYFFVLSNISNLALRLIREHRLPYGIIEYDHLKDATAVVKRCELLSTAKFSSPKTILASRQRTKTYLQESEQSIAQTKEQTDARGIELSGPHQDQQRARRKESRSAGPRIGGHLQRQDAPAGGLPIGGGLEGGSGQDMRSA